MLHGLLLHAYAVDDGTHTETQIAAGAVVGDVGQMGLGVKGDGLVARVVAHHVALATVDAHVLVDDGHHLLPVVKVIVGPDTRQRLANHVLGGGGGGGVGANSWECKSVARVR